MQGKHPQAHLANYSGIFQADAYEGYGKLYEGARTPGPILEAACWVHARRPFFVMADLAENARRKAQGKKPAVISPLALEAVARRKGRLMDAADFRGVGWDPHYNAAFPPLVFLQLLFGRRSLAGKRRLAGQAGLHDPAAVERDLAIDHRQRQRALRRTRIPDIVGKVYETIECHCRAARSYHRHEYPPDLRRGRESLRGEKCAQERKRQCKQADHYHPEFAGSIHFELLSGVLLDDARPKRVRNLGNNAAVRWTDIRGKTKATSSLPSLIGGVRC